MSRKVYFTVIFKKEVPVEIDYIEGQTSDEIITNCIELAKQKLTPFDWKIDVTVSTMDYLKSKLAK